MLWYFKDEIAYEYPYYKEINNELTKRYHKSVYEDSDEMEIYYALAWMKVNKIDNMSVVFPIKDLSVQYGNDGGVNKELCKKSGVKYRYENRVGGSMVLFPGNVIFLDITSIPSPKRALKYMRDFLEYLLSRGVKATIDNNDVLVDGKKIMGVISQALPEPYDGLVYFGAAISINSDAKLIDEICTKKMNKIPGALSDYKITTEDIMIFTLNWFDNHRTWEVEDEA